jgi:hypothetical protein
MALGGPLDTMPPTGPYADERTGVVHGPGGETRIYVPPKPLVCSRSRSGACCRLRTFKIHPLVWPGPTKGRRWRHHSTTKGSFRLGRTQDRLDGRVYSEAVAALPQDPI